MLQIGDDTTGDARNSRMKQTYCNNSDCPKTVNFQTMVRLS